MLEKNRYQERGRTRRGWTQDIVDLLHMAIEEAGQFAQDSEAYMVAVKTKFCTGQVTYQEIVHNIVYKVDSRVYTYAVLCTMMEGLMVALGIRCVYLG